MFLKAEGKMIEQEQENKQISEQNTLILEAFRRIVDPLSYAADEPPRKHK